MELLKKYYVNAWKDTTLQELVNALREYQELNECDKLEVIAYMRACRKPLVESIIAWENEDAYFIHASSRTELGRFLIDEFQIFGELPKVESQPQTLYELRDFIDDKGLANAWLNREDVAEVKFELKEHSLNYIYVCFN